nr:hypothetical protein [Alkalimonas amylolytica]
MTFTAPVATALPSSFVAATGTTAAVTFSLISGGAANSTSATYRVTAIDTSNGNSSIGSVGTIPALEFAKSNLAAGATVHFSAKTNTGLDLDTGGTNDERKVDLVKVVSQFTTTAPSFARVIDVEQQRRRFTDADAPNGDYTVDGQFNIVSLVTGGNVYARPITGVKHTLAGDFSWVRDTDANTAGIQPAAGVFVVDPATCPGLANLTVTVNAVSFECTAVAANTTLTIDPEANRTATHNPVLPTQTFSATSEVTYSGPVATGKVFDAVGAGSWTLNGSSVYIPYMLYGPTAEQTIQLTNKGNQNGDIFATAVVGGNTLDLGKVGTSNARTVTSLNAAIRNAMVAKGVNLAGPGNFAVGLTLVTNVPEQDVTVYSAYQRGNGDRLVVVNDSNGK